MGIKEVPQMYRTSDGEEFTDNTEAERHERLIQAAEEYEKASNEYGAALAESVMTADGLPFKFSDYRDYYRIVYGYGGLPQLARVPYLSRWRTRFDPDGEDFWITVNDEKPVSYNIRSLYAIKENAEAALVQVIEEFITTAREKIAKIKE